MKNHQKILKDVVWLVLATIILSSILNLPTSSGEGEIDNIDEIPIFNPQVSAGVINITTPENITYSVPMSGYYPAIYGFESDFDGEIPQSVGLAYSSPNGYIEVDAEKNGHKKVVEIRKYSGGDPARIVEYFDYNASSGIIEFWLNKDTNTGIDPTQIRISGDGGRAFVIGIADGDLYRNLYSSRVWLSSDDRILTNTWYHFKIDFNVSQGWQFTVDGNIYGSGYTFPFENSNSYIEHIDIGSIFSADASNYGVWVDAIGYSWHPDYNTEENKEEGLLLSFDNSTNLDWMGYSLDGQANSTILGNTTIPFPETGSHSIQVFGNESGGSMYESAMQYFNIGGIDIVTPENKTYTGAMSGYYPATYGFEGDKNGEYPNVLYVRDNGGDCYLEVQETLDGHNKIVEFHKEGGTLPEQVYISFGENRTTGTVEFWLRKDTASGIDGTIMSLMDPTGSGLLQFFVQGGNLYGGYIDGSPFLIASGVFQTNTWYHIQVDFDVGQGWQIKLNDIWYGQGYAYPFYLSPVKFDKFELRTHWSAAHPDHSAWLDALGFSWNPGYNIGDNKEEGLLLSFENYTSLDWMGYSLDGQNNITIYGNTTIPFPDVGEHSIQVYGNDTSGIIYQSDITHFTISDLIQPGIPRIIDMTNNDPSLYITVETNAPGSLEVVTTSTNLVGKGLGTSLEVYYFYNISIFDSNNIENISILTSITIRFYFDPTEVKKPENLKILHAVWDNGDSIWVWETMIITLNENQNYIELTTSELSVFCLAEIKIPASREDNPFLLFLMENMLWIIILASIGVAVPTLYVISKKQKKANYNINNTEDKKNFNYKNLEKDINFKSIAEKKRDILLKKSWKPEGIIEGNQINIKAPSKSVKKLLKKPKGDLDISSIPIDVIADFMQKREEELKQTEKEVEIEEKEKLCQIHKGPLTGLTYHCPKCKAEYCLKCATTLNNKNEGCWICNTKIYLGGIFQETEKKGHNVISPLDDNKLHNLFKEKGAMEKLASMSHVNISLLSVDFLDKVNEFDWSPDEKVEFLREMIGLTNSERELIINEIIQYRDAQIDS